jgi:hypothetical protein
MVMTPEAKGQLSKTIRALRTQLLEDFKSANDSTFKYSIRRIDQAKLSEANATRRRRIEEWIAEQVRGEVGKKTKRTAEDFRRDLEKQAAYTLLNRMLILRIMEAMGLHRGDLVAKGWNSEAYKSFRYFSQEIVRGEESEGYSVLLQMVFDDLAMEMPGLYSDAGVSDLIPVPTKTLRAVVDAFGGPELESCWTDDMTLGWVYQYWNDPERDLLDEKIDNGGKIEPHELASKTQMFTERYMVDWLLQNSLGPMWLAMCKKHGWTPLVQSTGTLEALSRRRSEWLAKKDAGEFSQIDLMPLNTELEQRWAYYLPQQLPEDAIENAPKSIRDLKILDPAVGSGHFLVVAFDLLYSLYQEESQHRCLQNDDSWSDKSIVESILENNLHGIDLDARAVQIAAAALWIKSKSVCKNSSPARINLVASNLGISRLPDNDPALVELRKSIEDETGIPAKLTNQIIEALRGADHLGSLLKIDQAIEKAIDEYQVELGWEANVKQLRMFSDGKLEQQTLPFPKETAARSLLTALETFLQQHSSSDELGLRIRGEQLAAGVRFVRLIKESSYDLVIANPPYQATSKLQESKYVSSHYKPAKTDLFAVFMLRGLELVREHGVSAMLTMRSWMFTDQYTDLRALLFENYDLRVVGDFDRGAFEEILDEVVSVAVAVFRRHIGCSAAVAQCPTDREDRSRDKERTSRKRSATLAAIGVYEFDYTNLRVIPGWPLLYWWTDETIDLFRKHKLIGDECETRRGATTGCNSRFVRRVFELSEKTLNAVRYRETLERSVLLGEWVPYIKGAAGRQWIDSLTDAVRWKSNGLELKTSIEHTFGEGSLSWKLCNTPWDKTRGVAYSTIGSSFSARAHRYHSVIDVSGATLVPKCSDDFSHLLCRLNASSSRKLVSDLNPSLNYQLADLKRTPLYPVPNAEIIFQRLEAAFDQHESANETSCEFIKPIPSPWRACQNWAQEAVDRQDGSKLPGYTEAFDPVPPINFLSFAFGKAIGRFGVQEEAANPTQESVSQGFGHGIFFLDGTLNEADYLDSLGDISAKPLLQMWENYASQVSSAGDLRLWLRLNFFADCHKSMYDNRPIYWPLSSRNKTFVAWIDIHRWNANTLRSLLADHLQGNALPRIDGELEDLRNARADGAKGSDARFFQVQKWKEELDEFIALVKECAEKGPPPTDDKCPKREVDARYDPSLDDGVVINSAALWPLLEPQWKDPKKWWKELAVASSKGNKDYDWSHLAMRYFPKRVDEKCQADPSLGVAHGCFWKYHPAKAWAWELRLQDEIAPDFRIEEASYRGDGGDVEHRATYLRDYALEAIATIEKEVLRRRKDTPGKIIQEMTILEPGLWTTEPEACWDMETRIIKKQEFGFRLIAPDDAISKASLLMRDSDRKNIRDKLLDSFSKYPLFDSQPSSRNTN